MTCGTNVSETFSVQFPTSCHLNQISLKSLWGRVYTLLITSKRLLIRKMRLGESFEIIHCNYSVSWQIEIGSNFLIIRFWLTSEVPLLSEILMYYELLYGINENDPCPLYYPLPYSKHGDALVHNNFITFGIKNLFLAFFFFTDFYFAK